MLSTISNKKERDSNIELLRIVATLFILIVHCNGWFLTMGGCGSWRSTGLIVGTVRAFIQSITCIGVDVFILISGFYSIRPKLSSLVNLFTLLLFFYLGCYIWNCAIDKEILSFSGGVNCLLAFSHENWFINCYLFLILLAPILNAFVATTDNKALTCYICVFVICAFYFGCVVDSKYFYFNQGYSVTTMILLYLIGRWTNVCLIDRIEKIKYLYILLAYIGTVMIILFVRFLSNNEDLVLSYCSPFLIVSSLCFFCLFYKMKFKSKIVNWIASSCLASFIFHTNDPVFSWFVAKDQQLFAQSPFIIYLIKMTGVIICIFIISILLDKIRLLIFNPIINKCRNTDWKK